MRIWIIAITLTGAAYAAYQNSAAATFLIIGSGWTLQAVSAALAKTKRKRYHAMLAALAEVERSELKAARQSAVRELQTCLRKMQESEAL